VSERTETNLPLKIGIVSLAVYPDSKDGSAKYIRGLFDALKRRGHQVKLFAAKWGEGVDDPDIQLVEVPQSRLYWVPKYLFGVKKLLQKENFDIIQANGSRGAIPIFFTGKKFIGLIHDVGPFETEFTKIPVVRWLEKYNAKKSQEIITNSEFTKNGILQYMGVNEEKIHIVYCGYDSYLKPEPEKGRKIRNQLNLDGPVIYYVGRIAMYKGVDQIIQAYYKAKKTIPNLNLVIGGKPTFKMQAEYERWKKDYPDIKFIGMVKDEDMAAYYSMGDVFCTYSYASEGFGITPIESIACGTPVICSDMPAYQEILADSAIFVPKNQPNALAQAFINYFNNVQIKNVLIQKGQNHILQYSWDTVADRTEKVYRRYLDKNK
jgi:glycosyltransferase involved in cell wall biosynthesis